MWSLALMVNVAKEQLNCSMFDSFVVSLDWKVVKFHNII